MEVDGGESMHTFIKHRGFYAFNETQGFVHILSNMLGFMLYVPVNCCCLLIPYVSCCCYMLVRYAGEKARVGLCTIRRRKKEVLCYTLVGDC